MKKQKTFFLIPIFILSFFTTKAQFPESVIFIDAKPNQISQTKGNLNTGRIISDLSWASSSSVACFPATQNSKFTGNHVLYGFVIPPYAEVTVTVIPTDKNANFSIYGYQTGTTRFPIVPELYSCVTCEAEHKWDYPKAGKTQDHTRSIWFNSTTDSYNIFIGVAGANGLKTGEFTLKVEIKAQVEDNEEQKPLKKYTMKSEKGKIITYNGDLSEGVKINDLSWASNSSVACFPATQNLKFRGNHIIYITEIPANSEMDVTVIPTDPKINMSIYGYQVGTTNEAMVPNLSSCMTCEAEYKWDYPKAGKTQDHTRTISFNSDNSAYRIVIGVAGADGVTSGTFKLKVTVR
jgi:hypothetical protein